FFLFNGFYAHRMLEGHLAFHAFMLLPWLACAVLNPGFDSLLSRAVACGLGGALVAYCVQSGMVHGIPPLLLAVTVIVVLHQGTRGCRSEPWAMLLAVGGWAFVLSAARLSAAASLLANVPRDHVGLHGFDSYSHAVVAIFRMLFLDHWFVGTRLPFDGYVATF